MAFASWRGVVGNIKPTMRPGSIEELCRILPEGVGIIPLFLDIQRGARSEFTSVIPHCEPLIGEQIEALLAKAYRAPKAVTAEAAELAK